MESSKKMVKKLVKKKNWLKLFQQVLAKSAINAPIKKIVLEYTKSEAVNEVLFSYEDFVNDIRERFYCPFFTVCDILEREFNGVEVRANIHAGEDYVEVVVYSGNHVLGTWEMKPKSLNFKDRTALEGWFNETYQFLKGRLSESLNKWAVLTLSSDDIFGACEQLNLSKTDLERVKDGFAEIADLYIKRLVKDLKIDPPILGDVIVKLLER